MLGSYFQLWATQAKERLVGTYSTLEEATIAKEKIGYRHLYIEEIPYGSPIEITIS
jgi:hypothetical protein